MTITRARAKPNTRRKPGGSHMGIQTAIIERITSLSIPEPNTGCWIWLGAMFHSGYGAFKRVMASGKKESLAHRVSYLMFRGEIPVGKEIDHTCKNRSCVNPNHLRAVTHSENLLSADHSASAANHPNKRKTHCKYGHPFDSTSTYVKRSSTGRHKRKCRICIAAAKRAKREALKSFT